MPPDVPEGSAARIASIAQVLSPGYAASGTTAAWLHGLGDAAPLHHHIQRVSDRRPRLRPRRNVTVHEMLLAPEDVEQIAAATVTTLSRTMTDLALRAHRDADSAHWLRGAAFAKPELLSPVRDQIASRPRLPGKRAALTVLEQLLRETGQEEVTR